MKGHPREGIFSIIWWIYLFSRICGLLPFSVEYNEKTKLSKVRVTISDWCLSILAICLHATAIYLCVVGISKNLRLSSVAFYASILLIIGSNSLAIGSIILDMINRKSIWKLVYKLNEFDEEVNLSARLRKKLPSITINFISKMKLLDAYKNVDAEKHEKRLFLRFSSGVLCAAAAISS